MMRLKSTTLEAIAIANGKPTGDDLRRVIIAEEAKVITARAEEYENLPAALKYLTSKQRKSFKRMMERVE